MWRNHCSTPCSNSTEVNKRFFYQHQREWSCILCQLSHSLESSKALSLVFNPDPNYVKVKIHVISKESLISSLKCFWKSYVHWALNISNLAHKLHYIHSQEIYIEIRAVSAKIFQILLIQMLIQKSRKL